MSNQIVEEIWQQHMEWSVAADKFKSDISFWRSSVLVFAISGAFFATISTQVPPGIAQQFMAWVGAVFLAVIPIVTPRKLSAKQTKDWIRARSISEGLKAELYTYFAQAGPYTEPTNVPTETLRDRSREITQSADDLVKHLATIQVQAILPPDFSSPEDYLDRRVIDQINWYTNKARIHADKASRLRSIEFYLAIAAALLAAATGMWGEMLTLGGWSIEIGVWVAVLTTIGGTLTAHIAAARYDHIVTSYSATAHQLRHLKMQWPPSGGGNAPSSEWSDFIRQCEDTISKENESWMAKWVKEDA